MKVAKKNYNLVNVTLLQKYSAATTEREKRQIETELIKFNEDLIHKNSHRWCNGITPFDFDELESLGQEAMLTAIRNFEPSQGNKFSTFAHPHLNGRVMREIRDNGSRIKIPQKVQVEDGVKHTDLRFVSIESEESHLQVKGTYLLHEQNEKVETMLKVAGSISIKKGNWRQAFVDCANLLSIKGLSTSRKDKNTHRIYGGQEIVQYSLL